MVQRKNLRKTKRPLAGRLFTSNTSYWLNGGPGRAPHGYAPLEDTNELQRDPKFPGTELYNAECLGVYYNRLQRDGWRLVSFDERPYGDRVDLFEKPVDHGWLLRKRAHTTAHHPVGKGCYYDEHELFSQRSGETIQLSDWEWADVDGHRLVWAAEGKLFAGRLLSRLEEVQELYDFNAMKFEPLKAPY